MLISIDGIDGCGKSTQIQRLTAALGADNIVEISDSRWGRRLRSMDSPTLAQQLALFTADRAGLVPRLEAAAGSETDHLVSDRSYLSGIAYQSFGSVLTPAFLEELNRVLVPTYDLMIFLDVPVELGLARVAARGLKRAWCETPDRLTWCRQVFVEWADKRDNIQRVDGSRDVDSIAADILARAEAVSRDRFGRVAW